jgi:4-amino-4-deoxy-L-arabinose transferase-like glycosyltransferase
MGWLGLFGLAYWLLRGRRRLDGPVGPIVAVALAFVLHITVLTLFDRASERYYRVLVPPAFALAGGGLYALWMDLERRPVVRYVLFGLLVAICLGAALLEPIRAHRRPQVDVGRWLRQYDPGYDGFVLSSYPQPVYYAGMRYLPSDKYGSRRVFRQLTRAGYWPRYVILDGDDAEEMPWLGELVRRPVWKLVHSEPERNIRIFEHTVRRRQPPARPTEAD